MTKRLLVLAAFASVIITALYLSVWVELASRGAFNPVDFWALYTGAHLVWDGHGNQLYDFGIQRHYQFQLLGAFPLLDRVLPFISPPHVALALLPLAIFPPQWAYTCWLALQMILIVLLLRVYIAESSGISWPDRIIWIGAFVCCPMLFVTIYKGQISLIILLCIILWIREMRKGNDNGIAVWLLIGSIKPQLIVVPFLLTILARRWKALAYFAAGGTLIAAICAISLGPESIRDFVSCMLSMLRIDSGFTVSSVHMYNFKSFLTMLLSPGSLPLIRSLTFAGFLCALIIVILLWRGRVYVDDERFNLKMALSLLLGIFFCPHLFYYDTLLLVVVAKLFHDYLMQSGKESARWLFIAIIFLIPPFFLKSSVIAVAGYVVRSSSILMMLWMLLILITSIKHKGKDSEVTPVWHGQ
jgi:hypothetical protein